MIYSTEINLEEKKKLGLSFICYCVLVHTRNGENQKEIIKTLDISKKTYDRCINELVSLNLYTKNNYTWDEAINLLKNKEGNLKCSLCGENVFQTEEHHYPIAFCNGGTKTIEICKSCHSSFHLLTNYCYQ